MGKRPKDWNFQTIRKSFCDNLRAKGYNNIHVHGNYVFAANDSEKVIFYFTAHTPQNKNYFITPVLKYKVDYFAFYNNKIDAVYCVGYGIVREYCKQLKTNYVFYNNYDKPKMLIPDSWALKQQINTMLLY